MTDKRSYVAICAGAAIGCEGFRAAGFECKLFVEYDRERQDVLRYNHPGVPVFGDVLYLRGQDVPEVQFWFVTLPCQPFSIGGRRRGLGDKRGRPLFDAFVRILTECIELGTEPRLILFENVPGWLQGEHEAAKCLCHSLGNVGFRPLWGEVLNAREFGVPQDRKRVILLFGRDSELTKFRERNCVAGRRRVYGQPLASLAADELSEELDREGFANIESRLRERSGASKPSRNMLQKCHEFVGMASPRPEWAGKAVFHSARNPRCFQPGFAPTVTKDARLLVRLPDSGKIFKVGARGYERLMGVRSDLTCHGVTEDGRKYILTGRRRMDACGDGVCSPVTEWIANAIKPLLGP